MWKKLIILAVTFLLILSASMFVMSLAGDNDRKVSSINYGYKNSEFTNNDGLVYSVNNNGVIKVGENYFGFGLTGEVNGKNYTYTSENFTWTWSIDTIGQEYIFRGYNNQNNFNWTQEYYFYPNSPMKIKHIITNDLGAQISNAKFWYIHTIKNGTEVSFNGNNYTLSNIADTHLKGNFNAILPKVDIKDVYAFNYSDLIDNGFDITNIYVGNGSIIGHPEKLIMGVGVTKGASNFPNGFTITLDPLIQATGAPDLPISSGSEAIVRNSTGSLFVLYSKDPNTFVAISDDNGATWRDSADTGMDCDFDAIDGGSLMINSTDALHIVCYDRGWFDTRSSYSSDNGDTWSGLVQASSLPSTTVSSAITSDDKLIACNTNGFFIDSLNSSDSGESWTVTRVTESDRDECDIEVDSTGRYHLAATDLATDDVTYFTTTDPTSWGSEILVNDGVFLTSNYVAMAIDLDDEVFIVTQEDGDTTDLSLFNSTDNGASWTTTPIPMLTNDVTNPDIVVSDDGTIHVIADEGVEIIYSNSTDGGLTWSAAIYLEQNDIEISTPHLRGSRYPTFNNVDGVLDYVFQNSTASDIYFGNYTIPLATPTVTLVNPIDYQNFTSGDEINFTVNMTGTNLQGLDLYLNTTGSLFSVNLTNVTLDSTTSTSVNFTVNNFEDGYWLFNALGNTSNGGEAFASSNFTFFIDSTPSDIFIDSPLNNSNHSINRVDLNVTATDILSTAEFWWYSNNSGIINSSILSIGTNLTASWDEGDVNITIYVNDTLNNLNSTSVNFKIDTLTPDIYLDFPVNNSNHSSPTIEINVSSTEVNLRKWWYSNSSGEINYTFTPNITRIWDEGNNFIYVWVNDTVGHENFTTSSFTVDTTSPVISSLGTNYTSLIPNTNITNDANVKINASIIDATLGVNDVILAENGTNNQWTNHTAIGTGNGEWHFNLSSSELSNQENVSFYFIANDSLNNVITSSMSSFFVENRLPTITSATLNQSSYTDIESIRCDASGFNDDDGEGAQYNIIFYSNHTATSDPDTATTNWIVNQSLLTTDSFYILDKGNLSTNDWWYCGIKPYDGINFGSESKSGSRQIGSSNSAPSISSQGTNSTTNTTGIISNDNNPTNNNTIVRFQVNITDSDSGQAHNLTVGRTNTFSTTWCTNTSSSAVAILYCDYRITDAESSQTYSWYMRVTDALANSNTLSGTYIVNHPPHSVTLSYPSNNSWINNASYLNNLTHFTAADDDSDSVNFFWHYSTDINDLGGRIYNETSSPERFNFSSDDTTYYVLVESIDSHGYNGSNSSVYQFRTDLTFPNVSATAQSGNSITNIVANWSINDTYLNNTDCKYNVTFSATGNTVIPDTTVNCYDNGTTFNVDTFSNYMFTISAHDLANNFEQDESSFSITQPSGGSPAGGGGGSAPILLSTIGTTCTESSQCQSGLCVNGFCEEIGFCGDDVCQTSQGETPNSCSADCGIFSKASIESGATARALIPFILITFGGAFLFSGRNKKKKRKKKRNG